MKKSYIEEDNFQTMDKGKVYKSKIDKWLFGVLLVVLIVPTVLILQEKEWFAGAVMLATLLFVLYMFNTTFYCINSDLLAVKSGFLVNKKIDIQQITKVKSSRSLLSSPALSLDRLELQYGKYDSVLISPKDKEGFVTDLLAINGEIVVEL